MDLFLYKTERNCFGEPPTKNLGEGKANDVSSILVYSGSTPLTILKFSNFNPFDKLKINSLKDKI